MKWKITIQSQRDHGHRSYCTFFQLPWLLCIWTSAPSSIVYMSRNALLSMHSYTARPTQMWPVLVQLFVQQPSWFSMYPFHKSLRDKKFRPRIGKLQWRPKWMKRYFKSSPPTSFCRLLRLLLFYKFVDFILSESPLKLLFNRWYQVQVKYFRSIYFSRGGTSGLPGWCFPGMRSKSGFLSKEIIAHKMRFLILKAVGVNSIQHFPWSHCSCNRQIDHLEN